jgi:hypothetical protein
MKFTLSSVISTVGMTQLSTNNAVVPNLTAYHSAFIAAAALVLLAACIGPTIRDSHAAATMRQ